VARTFRLIEITIVRIHALNAKPWKD